jgi:hypothetical protein
LVPTRSAVGELDPAGSRRILRDMPQPSWREYQEQAAEFFRSIGLDAIVDVTLAGARGTHAIDVVVTGDRAGIERLWIVECKQWKRPVGKDRVLTLSGVVGDVKSRYGECSQRAQCRTISSLKKANTRDRKAPRHGISRRKRSSMPSLGPAG